MQTYQLSECVRDTLVVLFIVACYKLQQRPREAVMIAALQKTK